MWAAGSTISAIFIKQTLQVKSSHNASRSPSFLLSLTRLFLIFAVVFVILSSSQSFAVVFAVVFVIFAVFLLPFSQSFTFVFAVVFVTFAILRRRLCQLRHLRRRFCHLRHRSLSSSMSSLSSIVAVGVFAVRPSSLLKT